MQITYSRQEMMAVFLARDLRDGEHLQVGYALPVAEAATRLAHHAWTKYGFNFFGSTNECSQFRLYSYAKFGWDN